MSDLLPLPAGAVLIECGICRSQLIADPERPGVIEHNADGSHTFVPEEATDGDT